MTVELTHGLCHRPLYDTPAAAWYLATVLWRSLTYPLSLDSCCPSFYVTSSIVAVKSQAVAISQWRDGLCLPAWTCRVFICWSSSWRAFVHSDGYFWMSSAQDRPVASCLGLNGQTDPLWPGCSVTHSSLFVAVLSSAATEEFHTRRWRNKIATCCLLQLGDTVKDGRHTAQWKRRILVQCGNYKSNLLYASWVDI